MKIDITLLGEDELIDLHRRLTERLRFLSQTRAHHKMLEFKIGDRVAFKRDEHTTVSGILTKYNKKTVTVLADNGESWNVSPGLLTLVKNAKSAEGKGSNVIQMPKRRGGPTAAQRVQLRPLAACLE